MVPVENKEEIFNIIKSDDVLIAFYNFVYNTSNKISSSDRLNDIRDYVLASFGSISQNDNHLFASALTSLSARQPTNQSHWIYDRPVLIFIMLYCCKYFNEDNSHIKYLLSLRKKSENPEKNDITNAFVNISNDHSDYQAECLDFCIGFIFFC